MFSQRSVANKNQSESPRPSINDVTVECMSGRSSCAMCQESGEGVVEGKKVRVVSREVAAGQNKERSSPSGN